MYSTANLKTATGSAIIEGDAALVERVKAFLATDSKAKTGSVDAYVSGYILRDISVIGYIPRDTSCGN